VIQRRINAVEAKAMKRKLLQLLADNRQAKGRISCVVQNGGEATIYLYDVIVSDQLEAEWFGGVTAQDLVPQIDQLQVDTIHLRINSPGGDVFAAQAIAAALKRNKAKVVAHIDGLAASAATAIAVVCDEILVADGSMFMIHNAWTIAMGDKNDFMDVAAILEKVDSALADQYAECCGQTRAQVQAMMDAETWFTAEECVAAGFADAIEGEDAKEEAAEEPSAMWNLAAFDKAPKRVARKLPAAAAEAPTEADVALRRRCAALLAKVPA
jgi:ATP-dependent Clp protease, protease subunit